MSNAYNLSLLASRNNLGNAGDVFISQGNDIAPSLGPLSAGVLSLSGINQLTSQIGVNKSTGVVTISAEPHLCELDVPGWDKGQHVTQWSTLQKYLSATALTNSTIPASAIYIEQYGSFSGNYAYAGATLAPNGKIYFAPHNATVGAILDPNNNTITTYGSFPGTTAYGSATLAPNGKIYFVPFSATVGAIVDPTNNTVTTYGSFPGNYAYNGGILAPNGNIYFVPQNTAVGRFIDPTNNTVTTYGSFPGTNAYSGAPLAANGKIYLVPHTATVGRALSLLNNNNFNLNICTNPLLNKY